MRRVADPFRSVHLGFSVLAAGADLGAAGVVNGANLTAREIR